MSTSASRSGAHASRTLATARSSNCCPASMIAASVGHATACRRHVRIDRAHGLVIGAAGDRRRRGEQPDAPVARRGDRLKGLGPARPRARRRRASSPSSAGAGSAARRRWRSCMRQRAASRRRASSSSAISAAKRTSSSGRAFAVREARGVAEIEEVLVREVARAARAARPGRRRQSRTRRSVACERPTHGRHRHPRPPGTRMRPLRLLDHRPLRAIIPERYGRGAVRALVVSNMLPDATHPERGCFVRDQVAALRGLDGLDVELYEFPSGSTSAGEGGPRPSPPLRLRSPRCRPRPLRPDRLARPRGPDARARADDARHRPADTPARVWQPAPCCR